MNNLYDQKTLDEIKDLELAFRYEFECYGEFEVTKHKELSYDIDTDDTIIGFKLESEMEDVSVLDIILRKFIRKYGISKYEHRSEYSHNQRIAFTWCLFYIKKDWKSTGD